METEIDTKTDFEEIIKNFKPEFGNENHIRALTTIKQIRERKKLVEDKLKSVRAIENNLKEIRMLEGQLKFLINS
jgi:hypothetical protein